VTIERTPAGRSRRESLPRQPRRRTITGPPYTIYVDAEAPAYGVSVRLKGLVNTNPTPAGSKRASPKTRSSRQRLHHEAKGGAQAPVANPPPVAPGQVESLSLPTRRSWALSIRAPPPRVGERMLSMPQAPPR